MMKILFYCGWIVREFVLIVFFGDLKPSKTPFLTFFGAVIDLMYFLFLLVNVKPLSSGKGLYQT
jgi:hypothetical protein